jgi:hypothetical protein
MTEWPDDRTQAITKLALMFPLLRGAPGTDPWDAKALMRWCATFYPEGERPKAAWAVRFVLAVANPDFEWRSYSARNFNFDLMEAWASWDAMHRLAALAWLHNPF